MLVYKTKNSFSMFKLAMQQTYIESIYVRCIVNIIDTNQTVKPQR